VTFLPLLPDFSVPFSIFFTAFSTVSDAFFEYFAISPGVLGVGLNDALFIIAKDIPLKKAASLLGSLRAGLAAFGPPRRRPPPYVFAPPVPVFAYIPVS
jgi:hypothetical protein